MNYIKFDTIQSTNDFLKSYSKEKYLPDFFYVIADVQTSGRGQQAHVWQSECCKNLLISFLVRPEFSLENQVLLNKIVSISLVTLLEKYKIDNVQVKLPNDIMADNKKIAGILIENTVKQQKLFQSVIGIGLNINQTKFVNLPNAVSMKNLTGLDYPVDDIATTLRDILMNTFELSQNEIHQKYNELSFYKPQ